MKRTVDKEQYFTPKEMAAQCLQLVDRHFKLADFDLIIEPSAGGGAFFSLLPQFTRLGIDIDPQIDGLIQTDFLSWRPQALHTDKILVVGNPPFGQRAALAIDFIEHSCAFADVFAFILPRSFKKYTFQNRVPLNFHLVDFSSVDHFLDADGCPRKVNAVFQIWEKRGTPRTPVLPPDSHPDFEMRHAHLSRVKPAELDHLRTHFEFAIAQVGSQFTPRDVGDLRKGSYWFVRSNTTGVKERFEQLDFSFLDDMNTAHKSLSKRDIIHAYMVVTGEAAQAANSSCDDELKLW